MTLPKVLFVRHSKNSKLSQPGQVPVACSYTERSSCAPSCALRAVADGGDGSCYASAGFRTRMAWQRADSGLEWDAFLRAVEELPAGWLFRHDVAGDLPHNGGRIDPEAMAGLVEAAAKVRGWTYTHHVMTPENIDTVRAANKAGFTVNLSADSLEHADRLRATGAGPVVVTVPADHPAVSATPDGMKVIVCLAQQRDNASCASCKLCLKAERSFAVAFRAHGTMARVLSERLKGGAQ